MCRKRLSSPRCRSELIDSAWVVIVPGQKCIKHFFKKCLESVGISPVNLHAVPPHSRSTSAKAKLVKVVEKFKTDISDACDVGVELNDPSDPISATTGEIRNKTGELDKWHEAMKEKLKIVSWSRKYCSEYFDVSEILSTNCA